VRQSRVLLKAMAKSAGLSREQLKFDAKREGLTKILLKVTPSVWGSLRKQLEDGGYTFLRNTVCLTGLYSVMYQKIELFNM
jgi:hypothetical protein